MNKNNKNLIKPANIPTDIKKQEWYESLVDDCRAIIVESEFAARWAIVECYWFLGERISQENDNFDRSKVYGKQITQRVAESLNRSQRTIEYAIKFYSRFPDLNLLPEGKNVSWKKIIQKYLTGPTEEDLEKVEHVILPRNIELINSDFRHTQIEPGTANLVLTDPPYAKEFLPVWDDLGAFGKKVLKPGGYLVTYSGHEYLNEVLTSLSKHLKYFWTFSIMLTGQNTRFARKLIIVEWRPVLVFYKEPFKERKDYIPDVIYSKEREKDLHEWQQSESGVEKLIEYFSQEGDLIVDPLSGSGTFSKVAYEMKRSAVGIEIDKTTHLKAKNRVLSFIENEPNPKNHE